MSDKAVSILGFVVSYEAAVVVSICLSHGHNTIYRHTMSAILACVIMVLMPNFILLFQDGQRVAVL